jgi:hypothetical protein
MESLKERGMCDWHCKLRGRQNREIMVSRFLQLGFDRGSCVVIFRPRSNCTFCDIWNTILYKMDNHWGAGIIKTRGHVWFHWAVGFKF